MLADVDKYFTFDRLSKDDVKYAFTHWLQNVLNMPLPVLHPSVVKFCRKFNLDSEMLTEFADRNDVNVALVDDWASWYFEEQESSREEVRSALQARRDDDSCAAGATTESQQPEHRAGLLAVPAAAHLDGAHRSSPNLYR
jgi:hypothetical protein